MPAYHLLSVAMAIGRTPKWVDNLVSHHAINGVTGNGRGTPRRVSPDGALRISLAATLAQELGVAVQHAVTLAEGLCTEGQIALSPTIRLVADTEVLREELETALQAVAENTVVPRRGRPPRKAAGAPYQAPAAHRVERPRP